MAEASGAGAVRFKTAEKTDPGRRENNEDAPLLVPGDKAERGTGQVLFGVIDGMGGYEAGEVASAIARDHLAQRYADGGEDLAAWISSAHEAIVADASENPERQGMGCVCTAGIIDGRRLIIGHVGDTRIYRLREGELEQITDDQSAVGEPVSYTHLTLPTN